jgi:hypothetical protein
MAEDGILLLSTKVDLSGANQLAAGVTSSMESVRNAAASANATLKSSGDSFAALEEKAERSQHSMMEARHGVMLLGEEFGVRLPRAVSTFVASIGPVGAAMELAFPVLAVVALTQILGSAIEKMVEMRSAAEKLAQAQISFGTTVQGVFNSLDDKLLETGKKTDELAHNHLAALQKELELINNQSFHELESEFGILSKAADSLFTQLKQSWYEIGSGSIGAQHALEEFKVHYDSLLATHKDKDAGDLLAGTLKSAKDTLTTMEAAKKAADEAANMQGASGFEEESATGPSAKELESQRALVETLEAQVTVQQKVNDLKDQEGGNAATETAIKLAAEGDRASMDQAKEAKQAADAVEQAWEKAYKNSVSQIEESERLKIVATQTGTQARIAAIDAAIAEERTKGLQLNGISLLESEFYQGLLTQRVEAVKAHAAEEVRIRLQTIDEITKAQIGAADQEAKRTLDSITTQAKLATEAQAGAYKQQTAQPFTAPTAKLDNAQSNADALLAIAQNEATRELAVESAKDQAIIQSLSTRKAAYEAEYAAGGADADKYKEKAQEVQEQITAILDQEGTKRTQIVNREADQEAKIQEQLLQTYLQVKQQEEAAISGFVTSATGDLNNFAVTIATTVGEVNGKISETRYIQEQFGRMFIEIERQFYQMILKMVEDTTAFKAVESSIKGVFDSAFKAIGLIKVPPPQPAGIPGLAGGVPLQGGQIPGAATGTAQQTAANGALTEFTTALHTASAALTQSHSATLSDTSATQASATATTADTAATRTSATATTIDTTATHGSTAATTVDTTATHTSTVAQLAQAPAVTASTTAQLANAAAVHTSTIAQIAHALHVGLSSIAHIFHQGATHTDSTGTLAHMGFVDADTLSTIAHSAAVDDDTSAEIINAVTLGFAQTGGLIQGPGTGTSDSIHMAVSHGEYIVKAAAVAQPGVLPMLHAINTGSVSGGKLQGPKAATGGLMDTAEYDNRVAAAMGGGGGDEGGGGSGGSPQFNSESAFHYHAGPVSALDQAGVGDVLNRHRGELTKIFHTAVKRGQIDIRQLLRRH